MAVQTWSIKIIPGEQYAQFVPDVYVPPDTPEPSGLRAQIGDQVSWNNQTSEEHRIGLTNADVFPIPSGHIFGTSDAPVKIPGYFKMRSRFVDFSGYYVLHCHILAHEDRGMMTVVEVAPMQTPFSHH